jgi:hypothetical protein
MSVISSLVATPPIWTIMRAGQPHISQASRLAKN